TGKFFICNRQICILLYSLNFAAVCLRLAACVQVPLPPLEKQIIKNNKEKRRMHMQKQKPQ
ncbi:MAG TPA: hypothetical protein IAA30_06390, partial [Candidatus Treponema faecavium]|nr:hypothetical protein [Candidatus Treponema faecavium]